MSPLEVAFSTLDEAWAGAVKLPEGWRLRSLERGGTRVEYIGGRSEFVEWWEAKAEGPNEAEQTSVGTFPAHALYHLVKDLAATPVPDPA